MPVPSTSSLVPNTHRRSLVSRTAIAAGLVVAITGAGATPAASANAASATAANTASTAHALRTAQAAPSVGRPATSQCSLDLMTVTEQGGLALGNVRTATSPSLTRRSGFAGVVTRDDSVRDVAESVARIDAGQHTVAAFALSGSSLYRAVWVGGIDGRGLRHARPMSGSWGSVTQIAHSRPASPADKTGTANQLYSVTADGTLRRHAVINEGHGTRLGTSTTIARRLGTVRAMALATRTASADVLLLTTAQGRLVQVTAPRKARTTARVLATRGWGRIHGLAARTCGADTVAVTSDGITMRAYRIGRSVRSIGSVRDGWGRTPLFTSRATTRAALTPERGSYTVVTPRA